jgi:hypothetical protein
MSKDLKGIIQPKDEDTVWRYMSFEKFANILATKSLFFTRADKYDDKFEGYVPESTTLSYESSGSQIAPNFRQYIMCNCWHHGDEESMAMWDKYHLRNNGIAIKTTIGNLKNSLPDEPNVFVGKIEYIEDYNQIDMLEDVPPEIWLHYPYFYKRTPFKYEQEVRAIIDVISCLHDDPYEFGRPLKIDVKTLIGENSEVIVSPYAEKWVTDTVTLIVEQYEFQFSVNRSGLLDPPT